MSRGVRSLAQPMFPRLDAWGCRCVISINRNELLEQLLVLEKMSLV